MKTIKTHTHYLLVDETAEIKEGDYLLKYQHNNHPVANEILQCFANNAPKSLGARTLVQKTEKWLDNSNCFKIIAASPKLGDLPEFETLPTEDNVIKNLAFDYYNSNEHYRVVDAFHWSNGYKQAKSETMFSLDDMRRCWYAGIDNQKKYEADEPEMTLDEYIQSLTKSKEYDFIPEMEEAEEYDKVYGHGDKFPRTKIINGKIQGVWKLKT